MDGLLQQNQDSEVEEVQASPEEQKVYEQYFAAAVGEAFSNGNTFKSLAKAIEATRSDPASGIARIALSMYEKAERKLGPLDDDDTTEAVGEEIIGALLDIAVETGTLTDDQVDEELAAATYVKLTQMWIEQNPDRAAPEDVEFVQQNQQQPQQQPQQQQGVA